MIIPLDQIANMPAFSPYYPMPPSRYRNARFSTSASKPTSLPSIACCPIVSNRTTATASPWD